MLKSSFIAFNTFCLLAATPLLAQEVVPESPGAKALEQVQEEVTNPNSSLSQIGKKAEEQFGILGERAQKEIGKYRIRFTVDPLGNIFGDDDSMYQGRIYYQYIVEPAFRNKEQLRRDIYVIQLGGGKNLSAGGQIRLSFTRYFGGPNAKLNAIKALPYLPTQIPLNSNQVKSKLKNGDGFRFEVSGDIAVGVSKDLSNNSTSSNAFLRYKRGGLFIMDLYKINEKLARTRFIGMKNRGEIEAGLGFKDPISSIGSLDKLSIGLGIDFRFSFSLFDLEPLSLDTMMADYLFNFSTSNQLTDEQLKYDSETTPNAKIIGEMALDQVMTNIRRGGFISIFMFFYESEDLVKDLLQKVECAEKVSKADLEKYRNGDIKFQDMRIFTYFKGKLLSNIRSFTPYASGLGLIGGSSTAGSIASHVTAYDENQQPSYYWLDNSFTHHRFRALFGRNKYSMQHDLDVLIFSDKDKMFGDLSDVVVRTQIEDTGISESTMKDYRTIITNSLPQIHKNNEAILDALPLARQTNAFISYLYSFGEKAFQAVGQLDKPNLTMKIINFFETHPERKYMHLPCDQGESSTLTLTDYAEQKAYQIANIFKPYPEFKAEDSKEKINQIKEKVRKERMTAFRIAKQDPIFERYLVGEFFTHILPQDKPDPYFGFDLKTSSFEMGTKTPPSLGTNKVSKIYDAVSFMRSIINDQSLDMQMSNSTDNTGNQIIAPAKEAIFNMNPSQM